MLLFLIFLFTLGLFIGSFLNVLVDRLSTGKNPLSGRSRCDKCNHVLSPIDLIPVVSFAIQGGKCRYCHKKLSLYYPLVELTTGVMFVVTAIVIGYGSIQTVIELSYLLFLISSLTVIFFTDIKYGIIPFTVVLGALGTVLGYTMFISPILMLNSLLAAIGAFIFLLLIFLITRGRGIGFGDVVYVFLMGFILGFPNIILGLYIAVLSGAIISLLLIGLKKKKLRGSTIPFGPFLVSGTVISLFWGDYFITRILAYLLG